MSAEPKSTGKPESTRSSRSLTAIRDAFLRLLQARGYDAITVRDISEEAKVGPATFYRHYPTKQALLDAIAGAEIDGLVVKALPLLEAKEGPQNSLALAEHVVKHRQAWAALLDGGAMGAMREGLMRRLSAEFDSSRSTQGWVPTDLGIVFAVTATLEIIAWWLRQPQDIPLSEVADYLDALAIAPTLARRERVRPARTMRVCIEATVRLLGEDESSIRE